MNKSIEPPSIRADRVKSLLELQFPVFWETFKRFSHTDEYGGVVVNVDFADTGTSLVIKLALSPDDNMLSVNAMLRHRGEHWTLEDMKVGWVENDDQINKFLLYVRDSEGTVSDGVWRHT